MPDRDQSIIQRLQSEGRAVPAVDLPDASDFGDLRVSEIPLRESGRFQVLGELAAGGVGQVLKGRDTDLGRDVALKVIHEEHVSTEHVVQRFIEEAQIGGQLQHPGIVPVYELGLQADRRPFFAMKLVKGRTLQALLSDRRDPVDDQRRFLQVFEEICQTVGYAHSRGVIHRDLKPANVMVGAFGEVQVLDWGFAKVLPRGGIADERASRVKTPDVTEVATVRSIGDGSNSIPGSVMGTLAYMPPEQALGQVEMMDERSDVFSLGAILTEILTGAPPYTGEGRDRLIQAAQCRLDDAHARLDECGADETLVELARQCLSPLTQDRPRTAAAVGEVVRTHLSKAEERARASAIKATRAREEAKRAVQEAKDQRRIRRLGLALAATVLAMIVAGGGSWAWMAKSSADRAEHARSAVYAAMTEAQEHRGREEWPEALRAAERAAEFAQADGVDEETRGRAVALTATVAEEEAAARAEAEQENRDEALLAELEEIRLRSFDSGTYSLGEADEAYAASFRAYGLEFTEADPTQVATTLRSRGETFAVEVASALDEWAWACRKAKRSSGTDAEMLVRVAAESDPDPKQRELRRLALSGDSERLLSLAADPESQELPVRSVVLLARALADAGKREARIQLLEEAARRHPGDVWVHYELAWTLKLAHRGPEALRHATAILALRPDAAAAHNVLGSVLCDGLQDYEAAEAEFRIAIRIAPLRADYHRNLGLALGGRGRHTDAIAAFREGVRLAPQSAQIRALLARDLLLVGESEEARDLIKEALRLAPEDPLVLSVHAEVLRRSGRIDRAIEVLRTAVDLHPGRARTHMELGLALMAKGRLEDAIETHREAARLDPTLLEAKYNLSLALAMSGKLEEAHRECERAIDLSPDKPETHGLLGFILLRLRRLEDCIVAYRKYTERAPNGDRVDQAYCEIATALRSLRRFDEAVEENRRAVELGPKRSSNYANLALALEWKGQYAEALKAWEDAARLRPGQPGFYDVSANIARCRRYIDLAPKIDAICAGKVDLDDPLDRYQCAEVCAHSEKYAAATRQYLQAFSESPAFAEVIQHQHGAAVVAALSGTGRGKESDSVSEAERAEFRQLSLAWLGRYVTKHRVLGESDSHRANLRLLLKDPWLAGVREEAELARLPVEERKEWKALWAEVRKALE